MAESRSKDKSPLAQDRNHKKRIVLFSLLGVLALICVILLTSYLYTTKRGEKWTPFAFLFGTSAELTLPYSPTIPLDILIPIAEGETPTFPTRAPSDISEDDTQGGFFTEASDNSETALPGSSPEETTSEAPTTEEPTTEEPTTEEPTTEEPTTEEPTTEEPTTEEPTTEEPTTEAPVTEEPTPEETTTEEVVFDEADLAAHLAQAGLEESMLEGTQLIVVRATSTSEGIVYFFEKGSDGWVFAAAVPNANAQLGEGGISGVRSAGSSVTPSGLFTVGPAYGTASAAITAMEYHALLSGDVWVTDPKSSHYNTLCNLHEVDQDWSSSIELTKQPDIYKYAIQVNYNAPEADRALGTSVFLNVTAGTPTDGSIGLKEATLFSLLQWLSPEAAPHILIYRATP